MGPLVVDLVTAILALTVLYARPFVTLGALLVTVLLVPATLVTPHLHTSIATVGHVVIAVAVIRLALLARRGDLPRERFRATPVHVALGLLLVTWGVVGAVFAGGSEVPATAETRLADLAFVIAFFVVVLALLREVDDPWRVLRMTTVLLAVTAAIAVVEHATGSAYGQWVFSHAGQAPTTDAAHVLETRAGHVRARSSGEFALAYSWVAVMLLPAATLVVLRARRYLVVGLAALGLVLVAIYWTYSRSSAAAVPAVFLLLALLVRDRRTMTVGALTAVCVLVLYAADPTIHHHLSLSTDSGSVGIRFQRLPPILAAVAHHPYLGLGLGGLQSIGVSTTDNFYLSAYSQTGVVGAAVLVAVCLTALLQVGRGLLASDPGRRACVAAAVIGFVGFLASGLFDDALLLAQPAQLAVLLVAIGTQAAEPEIGVVRLPSWSFPRIGFLTAAGAAAGLVAFAVAPTVVSQERSFTTVRTIDLVTTGGAITGQSLIDTVCALASATQATLPDTRITCRDDYTAPGIGTLRVEAPTAAQTLLAYSRLLMLAHRAEYLSDVATYPTGPPVAARATGWQTAPVSGAVVGFALAVIAPLPLRRRRRPAVPPPAPPAVRRDGNGTHALRRPVALPAAVADKPAAGGDEREPEREPVSVPSRRPAIPALDP